MVFYTLFASLFFFGSYKVWKRSKTDVYMFSPSMGCFFRLAMRSTDSDMEQIHTVMSTCASLSQNLWVLEEQHDRYIYTFSVLGCFFGICKREQGKRKGIYKMLQDHSHAYYQNAMAKSTLCDSSSTIDSNRHPRICSILSLFLQSISLQMPALVIHIANQGHTHRQSYQQQQDID